MNPSQIRARILHDHTAIRRQVAQLEDAVVSLIVDETRWTEVGELAHALLNALSKHTDLEDAILAPALLEIDAWGPVRSDQLLAHHQAQRTQIRELAHLYSLRMPARELARVTLSFVNDLRADMEHEERDVLAADLLRDDLVAISGESG